MDIQEFKEAVGETASDARVQKRLALLALERCPDIANWYRETYLVSDAEKVLRLYREAMALSGEGSSDD